MRMTEEEEKLTNRVYMLSALEVRLNKSFGFAAGKCLSSLPDPRSLSAFSFPDNPQCEGSTGHQPTCAERVLTRCCGSRYRCPLENCEMWMTGDCSKLKRKYERGELSSC